MLHTNVAAFAVVLINQLLQSKRISLNYARSVEKKILNTCIFCFMEGSVKNRLIAFIEYKGLSKNKFEKVCGFSQRYVSNISVSIQPDKLERISLNFPELNIGWLLTGEGEMLRKSFGVECEDDEREKEKGSIVAQRLKAFLDFKKISVRAFEMSCGFSNGWVNSIKEQIRLSAISEIASMYPELNLNWLFTGIGDMLLPEPASKASQDSPKLEVNPTNDIHHNQQVVIANWDDLRGVLEDVIKEQFAGKK